MTPRPRGTETPSEEAVRLESGSATARLHREAARYMVGGTSRIHYFYPPYPIYARSGSGCRLTDVEGVERLDFLNNMTSLIHGHADPHVNRAIVEQLERGTAYSEPSEPEVRLARLLVERVPSIERIRFANSGTEAVMLAIKLARAFTGRGSVAKFEGFYHGYYDYVQVSYSSGPGDWGTQQRPASVPSSGGLADSVAGDIVVLPFNDRQSVERLLGEHGRSLAALIVDPLSNRAGFPRPLDGFLDFLRRITAQLGIVLIFDEVISFRLAFGGAQAKYGGDPDLTTLGKIMGGGLPVGAVGGCAEIMALLDPSTGPPAVASGGTFSGNPLTMAAGLAAMERMTPAAFERLDLLGERLRQGANAALARAGMDAQLSGDGSLFRLLPTSKPVVSHRSLPFDPAAGALLAGLHRGLLEEGIIISRDGLGCLSTPMGEAEVDLFVGALDAAAGRMGRN